MVLDDDDALPASPFHAVAGSAHAHGGAPAPATKMERLAAALRDNIKRRKIQMSALNAGTNAPLLDGEDTFPPS